MPFNTPLFQRQLQQINAQHGGFAVSPGLRRQQIQQAAFDTSARDYNKMLASEKFSNYRNRVDKSLGLQSQRLNLAKERQAINFGLRRSYLDLAQSDLSDNIKRMRLGAGLGVGTLGLQGYLDYGNRKKTAIELQAINEQRAMQEKVNLAALEFYRKQGLKV